MAESTGGSSREWEKLSPAIRTNRADDLLSARRGERQLGNDAVGQDAVARPESVKSASSVVAGQETPEAAAPWGGAETESESYNASYEEIVPPAADASAQRLSARDAAVADRPRWLVLRGVVVACAVPILTLALAIRCVASSAFLWLEYHRPGFTADSYGFSTDERMTYGSYGLEYVLNFAPESYLQGLKTGQGNRLLTPAEVGHMTDVKHVLIALMILALVVLVLALLSSLSLPQRAPGVVRKALLSGAVATLVLVVVFAVLAVLGWESFFTRFHEIFFPQGNWEFRLSDTLIRLYPPQFWSDAALSVGVLTLLITALILLLTFPTKYRKALAQKRAEERAELRERLSR